MHSGEVPNLFFCFDPTEAQTDDLLQSWWSRKPLHHQFDWPDRGGQDLISIETPLALVQKKLLMVYYPQFSICLHYKCYT